LIFFFQAEDGIRDFHVTGVQTCALPISHWRSRARVSTSAPTTCPGTQPLHSAATTSTRRVAWSPTSTTRSSGSGSRTLWPGRTKIGRASCRERAEYKVVDEGKKKYHSEA